MKIAIDIDGVILNTENLFLVYAELYDIKLGKIKMKNKCGCTVEEKYDWTEEEVYHFWRQNLIKMTEEAELMPGAKIVINKLKEEGHTLIINTARGMDNGIKNEKKNDKIIDSAKEKFIEQNLQFDKYYWGVADKSIPCIEENVDVMIDDNYKNCINVASKKIHVLYFREIAAPEIKNNEYIHEVHNWGEIYRYIKNNK
jgi:hypothetical protein